MSKSLFTDEEIVDRDDHWYKLGTSCGLDRASNFLLNKTTELFKVGRDEDASRLRDLSKEIGVLASLEHPGSSNLKEKE